MDIYNLEKHLQVASLFAATLNIEERLRIGLALDNLTQSHSDIDHFKFWGRIHTPTKNYYIIVGYTYSTYQFPHKTFFWGTNPAFEFLKLTDTLYNQHKALLEKINTGFTGESEKVLVNLEEEGEEKEENQEQNQQQKNEGKVQQETEENEEVDVRTLKKNLNELNRLSVVVRAIENDCQIIPVGSYKMSPQHSLSPNQTYRSPALHQALDTKNWQHFRAPQSSEKRTQIEEESVIFTNDFLDTLSNDQPIGCWSSQYDISDGTVSVRNLSWPGYFAYQEQKSSLFGSCYFGDGTKNVNLGFQL